MPDSGRKDLIPMKRPLAYITAPWSENEFENTENAAKYCRAVYDAGFSPVCPTLFLPLFLRDEIPQEHNTVLVVSGFFKKDTTATAADKMMKVLEAETAATHKPSYTA